MKIDICRILLNNSDTEYQTIVYDTDDKKVYSTAEDEPLFDGLEFDTFDDAIEACNVWDTNFWGKVWLI